MGEENIDITFAPEELEPEIGIIMENIGTLVAEPSDNVDQKDIDRNASSIESTDRLSDKTTDVAKEEAEDLRLENQTRDGVIRQPSPVKGNPNEVAVGTDQKHIVRSRYRRASTGGSCHEACKYGHKHEFEKVPKKPLMGTIRENRRLMRTSSGGNLAKTKSVQENETKNKEPNRRLSLPGPEIKKDSPSHTESTNSSKQLTPTQPTQSKMKQVPSEVKSTLGRAFSRSKIDIPAVKKTPREISSVKAKEIKTEEAGSSSETKKVKGKEPMINSPRTLLKKSGSIKAKLYKDLKSFSRSRRQSNPEDPNVNKSGDVPEKALKSSLSNEESLNTQKESRSGKPRKSNVTKKVNRFGLPSFSSPPSSKVAASTARRAVQPRGDRGTGPVKEEGGSKTNTPGAETVIKTKAKKSGISRPEEKDGSAWKVKFKRGTVVNLPVASNSPRKLRFKRGKILGDDQTAKVDKNLKNIDDTTNESRDIKPEHEKVHLRRQEGSAKKDNIDLNDVIEETASKLVKTRKSKVKALVGAFETVMSFRDRKPLVETSAS